MNNLRAQLERCFERRVCLVGVGSSDYGDDGFGIALARKVADRLPPDSTTGPARVGVVFGGTAPERYLAEIAAALWEHVIFLDVAEMGLAPGSVVFLNGAQMTNRFPQVSTHRLSLGVLANLVEEEGRARAWLLATQPGSLKSGARLSPAVARSADLLADLLLSIAAPEPARSRRRELSTPGRAVSRPRVPGPP
jgi:hydrogenase maturation protease